MKCGRKPFKISDELIQKFSEIHIPWEGRYKGIGNILNISKWHARKIHNILNPPKQKEKKKLYMTQDIMQQGLIICGIVISTF